MGTHGTALALRCEMGSRTLQEVLQEIDATEPSRLFVDESALRALRRQARCLVDRLDALLGGTAPGAPDVDTVVDRSARASFDTSFGAGPAAPSGLIRPADPFGNAPEPEPDWRTSFPGFGETPGAEPDLSPLPEPTLDSIAPPLAAPESTSQEPIAPEPATLEAPSPRTTPEWNADRLLERILAEGGDRPHTIQGTHESLDLETVFTFLSTNQKTGSLRVSTPNESLTFEFERGDVVFTTSDGDPVAERLGDLLCAQADVDTERLQDYLLTQRPLPSPLGAALERAGLVSQNALREALGEQVRRRFYRAFSAPICAYALFEGQVSTPDDRIRLNVMQMLFDSARTLDEQGRQAPSTDG